MSVSLVKFSTIFVFINKYFLPSVGAQIVQAPEVMYNFNRKTYTVKADCWSLGVILYQLLSGKLPSFDDDEKVKMKEERWEEISEEAKDLMMKLIEVDPEERLSAAQALQHAWFQGDKELCREARTIMFDTEEDDDQLSNSPVTLSQAKTKKIAEKRKIKDETTTATKRRHRVSEERQTGANLIS